MPRRQPTEKEKKMVYGVCAAIMAVTLVAVVMVIVGSCGKVSSSSATSPKAAQSAQEAARPQAQVIDTEAATVEYRGTQDAGGNAVISFALTNKTGSTVLVAAENILVNDQFNVQSMTGSMTPIESGKTGSVAITFGVPTQTTLSGVSDLKTISADLVMLENGNSTNRVAVVPVTATI